MTTELARIRGAREAIATAERAYLAAVLAARGTMPAAKLARELGISRQRVYQLFAEARALEPARKLQATVDPVDPVDELERWTEYVDAVALKTFGKWNKADQAEQGRRNRINGCIAAGPGTKGYRRAARFGWQTLVKIEQLEAAEESALGTLEHVAETDPRAAAFLEQVRAHESAKMEAPIPF